MTTKRIQNVYYTVSDMARASAFYRDALALTPKFADGERWTQFDVGGSNFALSSAGESAVDRGAVAVFEAADVAEAEAAVVRSGGTILARRDMGSHGLVVTASDPDGNVFQLFGRPK
jgi:predicted enzyme related to lactoylglutathione lyase